MAETSRARVTLLFSIPFNTVWGENVVLVGDEERLGGWEACRGVRLQCHHVGSALVWRARMTLASAHTFRYRYVLVDEQARTSRRGPARLHASPTLKSATADSHMACSPARGFATGGARPHTRAAVQPA
jgi:hypothetical protein